MSEVVKPIVVPCDPVTLMPFPPTEGHGLFDYDRLLWAVKDGANVFMATAPPGSSEPEWVKSTESLAKILFNGHRLEIEALKRMYDSRDDMP